MTSERLKVLRVETGLVEPDPTAAGKPSPDALDYQVYAKVPKWWRRLEELLRLDIYLAWQARRKVRQYDVVWAGSEKVAIPLTLMGVSIPQVVIVHHMSSQAKAKLARGLGIVKKWAGVGYISDADRDFLVKYFQVVPDRLFRYQSVRIDQFTPEGATPDGPIMSFGVSKRDYPTLLAALADLPGFETEIFASSKYGEVYTEQLQAPPPWVHFEPYVSGEDLIRQYQRARFVVIPLHQTTQHSVGVSVALEASACGKAVIATSTEGMPSFVVHGETGLLVPPYDGEALRSAICQLWNDPDLAHQMGLAGRRYVETYFNPGAINSEIAAMLNKVYQESATSRVALSRA